MDYHRFFDEAGDTAFYGKGKKNIIGKNGVSNVFILGMIKVKDPLDEVRGKINSLQKKITNDEFYHVPSVVKKLNKNGYYLHATDDLPEVRKEMFDLMKTINCSFGTAANNTTSAHLSATKPSAKPFLTLTYFIHQIIVYIHKT